MARRLAKNLYATDPTTYETVLLAAGTVPPPEFVEQIGEHAYDAEDVVENSAPAYAELKVEELRAEIARRGLDVSTGAKKPDLVAALEAHDAAAAGETGPYAALTGEQLRAVAVDRAIAVPAEATREEILELIEGTSS